LATFAADDDGQPEGNSAHNFITPETQRAIDHGLAYLAQGQLENGSFGERGQYASNVAVTALSAMALMAAGHQPGRGAYGRAVERAIEFVLSQEAQDPDRTRGFLCTPVAGHGPMYSHGFGTLLLGEAYGMIPKRDLQRRVRDTLERAVNVIVTSQNTEGGWRYQPKPREADLSVTICQIMALRSARNAGLHVPKSTVDKCTEYVKACQNRADGGFTYFRGRGNSAFARSAAGVVALYCAGIYRGPEVDRGLRYLMQFKPSGGVGRPFGVDVHYYYGHYYAAQAMWTAGGEWWKEWFPAIRDELVSRGRLRGSDGVWFDPTVCNQYATAMALIILQIPNNYLPILQK
jgi:uncharacterized protein YfaS (alpha-2-macroglobulin family)